MDPREIKFEYSKKKMTKDKEILEISIIKKGLNKTRF